MDFISESEKQQFTEEGLEKVKESLKDPDLN